MRHETRVAIYVRVSTAEQNVEGQEAELVEHAKNRGWQVSKIYRDKLSGAKQSRPALDEMMTAARHGQVDIVLVWRFDRFARSVSHLLQALELFRSKRIEFVSLREAIDTNTPGGKALFTMLGAVAELERSLIAERVRLGVQNAKRKGKRLGRPPIRALNPEELVQVLADRASGNFSLRELAEKYGTSVWAMHQATRPVASAAFEN